ncbi:hypothetical protein TAMA11512_23920 [Selenomonas sp. TAMA-11512]|uniref:Sir2 silent information regulator family NAD-dependent deacetylase n=1 Tax=Selenomonas sp. TAMA-11512 TaxID=3095337 RepID=UPI0030866B72|nr:hypothetical protein TAMA11512_23920 [Selenomonas sp. TAMA-11512]
MGSAVIYKTTGDYASEIKRLYAAYKRADAILVGAGSGLSTSAGLDFAGERLQKYFGDFVEKYGMKDMYTGCFSPFDSREERWSYWSRWAWINRYEDIPKDTLKHLLSLLDGRDYFVLTTNIDHTFLRSGCPKDRLCYTQGDFGLFQCSKPCHQDTYDNEEMLRAMRASERGMRIDGSTIPHCPKCGREMDFSLYWDHTFVRDKGWHIAHDRYEEYIAHHSSGKILYLELGVDYNSPGVIKIPFWNMVYSNPDAVFASVNLTNPSYHSAIADQSIVISEDIDTVIRDLCRMASEDQNA